MQLADFGVDVMCRASAGPPSDEGVRAQQEVSRPRADDDDSGTAAQLLKEQRARAELEDMLLRIERHFKLEQAARKKAEEELEEVRAGEAAARAEVDAEHARFEAYAAEMDQRNAEMHADAASVDAMRQDYEEQLADLRHQLQEAQQVGSSNRGGGKEQISLLLVSAFLPPSFEGRFLIEFLHAGGEGRRGARASRGCRRPAADRVRGSAAAGATADGTRPHAHGANAADGNAD
jgi:hypothetical protein